MAPLQYGLWSRRGVFPARRVSLRWLPPSSLYVLYEDGVVDSALARRAPPGARSQRGPSSSCRIPLGVGFGCNILSTSLAVARYMATVTPQYILYATTTGTRASGGVEEMVKVASVHLFILSSLVGTVENGPASPREKRVNFQTPAILLISARSD